MNRRRRYHCGLQVLPMLLDVFRLDPRDRLSGGRPSLQLSFTEVALTTSDDRKRLAALRQAGPRRARARTPLPIALAP
jgi:hypothetical protein